MSLRAAAVVLACLGLLSGCKPESGKPPLASLDPAQRPRSSNVLDHECPELPRPRGPVRAELVALLEQQKYDEVEARLAAYDQAYTRNVACEAAVWDAYGELAKDDARAREWIDRWVEQRPRSWAARVVRGALHHTLGYAARGEKLAKDTSEAEFAAMRAHFEQAIGDTMESRELGPLHMVAAGTLLSIERGIGGPDVAMEWVETLLKADPLNYGIRRRLMHAAQPRWGGSLELMQQVADEAQPYADRNPRLRMLLGWPHAYRGMEAVWKKQPQEALHHYSKALEYGDYGVEWSLARARQYLAVGRPARGHADMEYAKHWSSSSDDADVWFVSGRLFNAEEKWSQAIPEFDRAVELAPDEASHRVNRGFAHESLGHWEAAEADYRAAYELDPTEWEAAHLGIVLYRGLGRPQEAIEWLELAAREDPGDANVWFHLAQAQEQGGEGTAARSYEQFLKVAASTEADRIQHARRYLGR